MKVNVLLFDSEKSMIIMMPGAGYNYSIPSSYSQDGEDMFATGKRIIRDKFNLNPDDVELKFLSYETGSEQTPKDTIVRNETNLVGVLDDSIEGKVPEDAVWFRVPYVINMSTDNTEMLRTYYTIVSAHKLIHSDRY